MKPLGIPLALIAILSLTWGILNCVKGCKQPSKPLVIQENKPQKYKECPSYIPCLFESDIKAIKDSLLLLGIKDTCVYCILSSQNKCK